tara:strand:+ start:266 stop:421 length:156 start_codon:yes stop_codon:yes gene_type:complete
LFRLVRIWRVYFFVRVSFRFVRIWRVWVFVGIWRVWVLVRVFFRCVGRGLL